jgi:hypothetical protein
VFYAHASVGELHLRPMMDLTKPEGLEKMKQMAQEIAQLVKKYRGSLSGEHGDGRARSPFIETVLGKEMMPLLRQVKEIWDPDYRFNPGKIVNQNRWRSTCATLRIIEVRMWKPLLRGEMRAVLPGRLNSATEPVFAENLQKAAVRCVRRTTPHGMKKTIQEGGQICFASFFRASRKKRSAPKS